MLHWTDNNQCYLCEWAHKKAGVGRRSKQCDVTKQLFFLLCAHTTNCVETGRGGRRNTRRTFVISNECMHRMETQKAERSTAQQKAWQKERWPLCLLPFRLHCVHRSSQGQFMSIQRLRRSEICMLFPGFASRWQQMATFGTQALAQPIKTGVGGLEMHQSRCGTSVKWWVNISIFLSKLLVYVCATPDSAIHTRTAYTCFLDMQPACAAVNIVSTSVLQWVAV